MAFAPERAWWRPGARPGAPPGRLRSQRAPHAHRERSSPPSSAGRTPSASWQQSRAGPRCRPPGLAPATRPTGFSERGPPRVTLIEKVRGCVGAVVAFRSSWSRILVMRCFSRSSVSAQLAFEIALSSSCLSFSICRASNPSASETSSIAPEFLMPGAARGRWLADQAGREGWGGRRAGGTWLLSSPLSCMAWSLSVEATSTRVSSSEIRLSHS